MLQPNQPTDNPPQPIFFDPTEKIAYLLNLLDEGRHIFPLHDLLWGCAGLDEPNQLFAHQPGIGLARGPFLPYCSCTKSDMCSAIGKHPRGKWSRPLNPADPRSRDVVSQIVAAWPARGWGIHLGLSRLVVVDMDPRNGGKQSWAEFVATYPAISMPRTVITGGGGGHWYLDAAGSSLRVDPIKGFVGDDGGPSSTCVKILPGIDVLAGQHYVVLPYSPHRSGSWYRLNK